MTARLPLCAFALCAALAWQSHAAEDKFDFTLSQSGTLSISLGDQRLSNASRLIAIDPSWDELRWNIHTPSTKIKETADKGFKKAAIESNDPSYAFKLKEYSAETGPSCLTIRLEGEMGENIPTIVEHSALVVPSEILTGASYTATLENGNIAKGRIGIPGDVEMIIQPFVKASFKSPVAAFTVEVLKGAPVGLSDRRNRTFLGAKCFWLGSTSMPVSQEKPLSQTIRITNDGNGQGLKPLPSFPLSVKAIEERPAAQSLPLIPKVKERADIANVFYAPKAHDKVMVKGDAAKRDMERLNAAAKRILSDEMGVAFDFVDASDTCKGSKGVSIEVGMCDGIPVEADSYELAIDAGGAVIKARDARGAFYGLQTLKALFNDGKLPGTKIKDWPDFPVRGLHLLADDHALEAHGELIRKVMAPLKMNHILYECEYVNWDSTKPIHQTWGMPKDDLRKLMQIADENFIEMTPLLQTMGHCQWLFKNDQNLELAENPASPYAYDVSNPAVYSLMSKILDEVFEVFKPRYLHIGHDEITMCGKYPSREGNVKKGAARLLVDDVLWYRNFAKERDVRIMMWHDMLVTRAETCKGGVGNGGGKANSAALRGELPRDILLVDWQYSGSKTFPEMDLLKSLGFEVMGATWSEDAKDNIVNLSAYAKGKATGMFDTTWIGYNGNEMALVDAGKYRQIAAYVRSADSFWESSPDHGATWSEKEVLARLLKPAAFREVKSGKGRALDISAQANIAFSPETSPFGFDFGIEKLPQRPANFGGVIFQAASRESFPAAVTAKSRRTPNFPETTAIPLDAKASALYFLHTTASSLPNGSMAGEYVVEYKDGGKVSLPIRIGETVASPFAELESLNLQTIPHYEWSFDGRKWRVFVMKWTNPEPGRKIASVSVKSTGMDSSLFLMGLSLAD